MSQTEHRDQDTRAQAGDLPIQGPPRWATALGIAVAILAIAVLVLLHLTGVLGGGSH